MLASTFTARFARHWKLVSEVANLPVADLHFDTAPDPAELLRYYRHFTKRHPRYKIIRNKTLGAALIDLQSFSTYAEYLDSVQGKGNGGPQSRQARSRGYWMQQIDRNNFVEEIHSINMSSDYRQGRPMDAAYREKVTQYHDKPHGLYFGMFNKDGTLVAYCNVGLFGNFAATEQVLGYKTSDGVMYLLFTEIVGLLIERRQHAYFMYDTVFGAQEGLKDFKRRLGFKPYRARYTID